MTEYLTADTIVFAAGLAFVLGYLIINQVILRLMVLIGTGLYIVYYSVAADEPLWSAIWTSVAMGLANLIGLFSLFARRSKLAIPREHKDIYPRFKTLPPGDFRALVKMAKRHVISEEREITTEGERVQSLYYVLNGSSTAHKAGHSFKLPADIFIGEVAFLTGRTSSATTILQPNSEVLEWDFQALQTASKKDRFRLALEALISKDLASKVSLAVAPSKNE